MPRTTKALVVRELDAPFKLEDIILDSIKPDEALVEIHYTGICHSDVKAASGKMRVSPPVVLGHEGAGVVLEVGENIKGISPGDKVLLSYAFCGNCEECKSHDLAYCENIVPMNFGGHRPDGTSPVSFPDGGKLNGHFFGQSCFAKLAVVNRSCLVKVPADTPLEIFAPLGCGIQTGAGSVLNALNVQPGTTLAVFGVGPVGLSAVMAGKIRGAKKIIAVDLHADRLELAKRFGATDCILGSEDDIVQKIVALCPPHGVRYAADCSGVPKVVEDMVDSLGIRGRACTIGSPGPGPRAGVNIANHLVRGREYVGSHQGGSVAAEMIPWMIEQHSQGNFPLEEMITEYHYEDYEQAFADLKSGKTIKAVLRWK